ncbi:MAG TPA: bZIP transcription factor [Terriglobales bacterium]
MIRLPLRRTGTLVLAGLVLIAQACLAQAQVHGEGSPASLGQQEKAQLVDKLDKLLQQNEKLEEQNHQLLDEIRELRQKLAGEASTSEEPEALGKVGPQETAEGKASVRDAQQVAEQIAAAQASQAGASSDAAVSLSTAQEDRQEKEKKKSWGTYTPNLGFKVASTEYGDLSISIYSYVRYLNQNALAPNYINGFGQVVPVVQRQDVQLQKLQFKFLGWVMSPNLTYYLWAWTSNPTMGQPAQVVLAGNLKYKFSKYLTLGGGIYSLPGTRSVEGNFPFWLSVDTRLIADEFFRPSYSTGIQASGDITDRLRYQAMLANNTSQLGVSALQLDNGLNTFAGALVWEAPDFGIAWGDFDDHKKLAYRLGAHYNRSHETVQSQPGTESIDNTQIRLGDGTIIFTPNIFGPGIAVNALDWRMTCADVGLKYHGFSLDAEYYWRWLNNFTGPGTAGLPEIFNHGFQLQASGMAIPKTLQFYTGGSMVLGNLGGSYDTRVGLNWFPWKNKVVRWNAEGLLLYRSPVGYTSLPYNVGSTGFVFHTNLEMAF